MSLVQKSRPRRSHGADSARMASSGRRIGSRRRQPGDPCLPLDLGRTLNSAVLRKASEPSMEPGQNLAEQDLHLQVRCSRPRRLIVFLIDTSDSMGDGPEARIAAGLGACLSLAASAYLNRDQVCLITFRDREAQLVVPPTNSVTMVRQQLQRLPVGGATPLAAGLQKAMQVIRQGRAKNPEVSPLLVLISDGEATVPLTSGALPEAEVLEMAASMSRDRIQALVIDTLASHQQQRILSRLAKALGTKCLHIHDLHANQVLRHIEISGPA
jgi:magnesium chelatase subunit D